MGRISSAERTVVRARLLRTAAEHFAQFGYDGASINRISLDAGYAKGTVYGYFDSKAVLFGTVLELGSEATVARYREVDKKAELRAELEALARADIELVQRHEAFARVLMQEYVWDRAETRDLVSKGMAPIIKEATHIFRRARRDGEISSTLPMARLGRLFCTQLSMLYAEHWRSGSPTWEEMPGLLSRLFMDGLVSRVPNQP